MRNLAENRADPNAVDALKVRLRLSFQSRDEGWQSAQRIAFPLQPVALRDQHARHLAARLILRCPDTQGGNGGPDRHDDEQRQHRHTKRGDKLIPLCPAPEAFGRCGSPRKNCFARQPTFEILRKLECG